MSPLRDRSDALGTLAIIEDLRGILLEGQTEGIGEEELPRLFDDLTNAS